MSDRFGFVFPGQGSQKLGMLADYQQRYNRVNQMIDDAKQALGYDLWEIIQNDVDKLSLTEYTQPALLAASVTIWHILKDLSLTMPDLLAGHSLGEYSALVCAEAIEFTDALRLVAARGKFMQQAVADGQGAMSAIISLTDKEVESVCDQVRQNQIVAPANFNAPGQVVISGEKEAVIRANKLAKEQGARMAKMLPVSVPSHCELMKPAAESLAKVLAEIEIKTPKIPIIHNVNVDTLSHPDDIRDILIQQLYSPVRWTETIIAMQEEGVNKIVECGPGKVLSGLNKRIVKNVELLTTAEVIDLEKLL